jgi:NAD(P)-dependent dehydrogenase (short-subunit alcohol dehydrogenase family)
VHSRHVTRRGLAAALLAAGSADVVGPLWEADPDTWWDEVAVHLRGAMLLAHACLPGMIARARGATGQASRAPELQPTPAAGLQHERARRRDDRADRLRGGRRRVG